MASWQLITFVDFPITAPNWLLTMLSGGKVILLQMMILLMNMFQSQGNLIIRPL